MRLCPWMPRSTTSRIQALDGEYAPLSLNLSDKGIADLATADWTGMPIGQLDRWSSRLTSIEPLQDLLAASVVDVSYNRITDATPVGGLSELIQLSMHDNLIADPIPWSTTMGSGRATSSTFRRAVS